MMAPPFAQIADKLRRAARNQERLHLDYELVMAILTSPLYPEIARLESEELASTWQGSSLENSGSDGERTGRNGQYAGTTEPLEPAAASQLAFAATTMAIRRAKQSKNSSSTTGSTAKPKQSTRAQKRVLA